MLPIPLSEIRYSESIQGVAYDTPGIGMWVESWTLL